MPASPARLTKAATRRVARYARRLRRAGAADRNAFYRSRPVRPDTVLYESFAGNGMLCNPEAIFRKLLHDPDFRRFTHIWALDDDAAEAAFDAEFSRHPRVKMVKRGSGAYWKAVSTSRYLVNNATFPPQFGKREGQIYLNTWHGTPLKHMGFDMPDGAWEAGNTLRNFLSADYLLAANPFMAEGMYEDAYRLHNVYTGRIVTEGYPRIDRQFLSASEELRTRDALRDHGLEPGDLPIVLYAPTWKGASFQDPTDDLDALAEQTTALQAALGDGIRVFLKTHQVVHRLAAQRPELKRLLVPNTIPTNALLGAAAGLVTDYSSIFFDYLATGRPIVFLTPDADDYHDNRGTYFSDDELPGPVIPDATDAGAHLRALLDGTEEPTPRYAEWKARFTPYDDGDAASRVIDVVFRGRTDGYRVRPARTDGRKRLLFFLGGMKSNGITTSVLNLLNAIDHDVYDVTALMPRVRKRTLRENQKHVHPAVRQVFRIGGMNGSKLSQLRRKADDWRGTAPEPHSDTRHSDLWNDEWVRILGDAEFDWLADFSGYSPFWSNLLLRSPDMPRAVWLHNEMAADRKRTVDGKQPFLRSLGLVFSLYRSYDQLVSVSPLLTELNRAELEAYAPADRFVTVRNLPNVARVTAGKAVAIEDLWADAHGDADEDAGAVIEPPVWAASLASRERAEKWFITVGRLSPEKNQARLLRAFARVHAQHPEARLLIVGGGPLHGDLETLAAELGLTDAAFLAGPQSNPFALMAAADCFVLSSRYEGQPMVLLEAALCDLPIVSTSFASVRDALPNDTIHAVAQSDEALRDGMLAFLDGKVDASHLDIPSYVREVTRELDAVIAGTVAAGGRGAAGAVAVAQPSADRQAESGGAAGASGAADAVPSADPVDLPPVR
ncbi:glycosyltransferase [Microbacterium candidum]|uniref:Glycosyltransferase n=1 Tax=Microbacterium candidum TaxID=3041922 RepID=A0ABT7MVM5_9MICO|nr:glycosyltransferase [Microbacterium sp. ASV49]MDL9978500.1 glycosyltransferase [Microbacterium sp. ASV49]